MGVVLSKLLPAVRGCWNTMGILRRPRNPGWSGLLGCLLPAVLYAGPPGTLLQSVLLHHHISLEETHSFSFSVETKAEIRFPSNTSFYFNFEVKSIFHICNLNQSNSIYNQVYFSSDYFLGNWTIQRQYNSIQYPVCVFSIIMWLIYLFYFFYFHFFILIPTSTLFL